jgi:hypothetical protein
MEMSGQFHAPAAFFPAGNGLRYPFYRRLSGPWCRSGRWGEKKILLRLSGIKTQLPRHPAYNLVAILTELKTT